MLSKFNTFYVLGAMSLIGAGLFPLGYLKSFDMFLSLFILGLVFMLVAQSHQRKK